MLVRASHRDLYLSFLMVVADLFNGLIKLHFPLIILKLFVKAEMDELELFNVSLSLRFNIPFGEGFDIRLALRITHPQLKSTELIEGNYLLPMPGFFSRITSSPQLS